MHNRRGATNGGGGEIPIYIYFKLHKRLTELLGRSESACSVPYIQVSYISYK